MNFSVVLIAKNEALTLPRLMGSLTEFRKQGGEIVLVDTGSTDGTPDIARELGCRVEEVGARFIRTVTEQECEAIKHYIDEKDPCFIKAGDTLFDYSSARNYAATLATNNMVAMPDCDEEYTKLDIDTINSLIEKGAEQLEYNFVFSHDEHGREVIKFLHCKFYDRRKLKWVGIIHEVLHGSARKERLEENVIKLEHWQNPSSNRGGYLKGLALAILDDPTNDRNSHYFGRELMYAGYHTSAIKELERHIAMGKWPEERSQSQIHIGECFMALGQVQKAIHSWIDALDTCPARREPLMKIAEYYYRAKSPRHVIAYASAAMTIPNNSFYATFQPYYQHIPHEMLYWAWWEIGDKVRSHAHFDACIRLQPYNSKYLRDSRWYWDLPKVSIIIPTLRAEGLARTIRSIEALNYPKEKIETIILRDEPRIGVPKRLKEGVEKATGEFIVYGADDMEFHPDCIIAGYQTYVLSGQKKLIAFNGGPVSTDEGNICEHFMITRGAVFGPLHGEIFDTQFNHVGVDNLLWAIMNKAGEATRSEHARFTHHHFSKGGDMDDVYKIGWNEESVKADRALLAQKLKHI